MSTWSSAIDDILLPATPQNLATFYKPTKLLYHQTVKMTSAVILWTVTYCVFLQFNWTAGICPGDNYTSKIPLYFGYMAATDPNSNYDGRGTQVAVNLAVDRINSNDSLLYGYTLSYNGTVFDSKVNFNCTYNYVYFNLYVHFVLS